MAFRFGFFLSFLFSLFLLPATSPSSAQQLDLTSLRAEVDSRAEAVTEKVVTWRRDIHQHPELGNREFRTAALVADHLRSLGMEVETEVAHTGVVGVLQGGLPGPVVALRADMDALPVTELADLPFASKVRTEYNGQDVGVMHACGHDNHTAILMGAAEVLAGMKDRLPGTVKFLFTDCSGSTDWRHPRPDGQMRLRRAVGFSRLLTEKPVSRRS